MGITAKFVEEMILRFKEGKGIPRRYVWEIALTVHELLVAEESLVNITLEKGMTCDVIGDVHGQHGAMKNAMVILIITKANSMTCCIYFL